MSAARSVPWLTDEEFMARIAQTPREGDRLILLAIWLHDGRDNVPGPHPGSKRIARLTGLAAGTVRNRLPKLPLDRIEFGRGTVYLIRPVTPRGDVSPPEVTSANVSPPEVTPQGGHVTDLSPPEVHRTRTKDKKQKPKTSARSRGDTWLTPFIEAWREAYGGDPTPGELAKRLAPVNKVHGPDNTLAAWRRYLARTGGEYVSPKKFAETFGVWAGTNGRTRKPTQRERNENVLDEMHAELERGQ